MLRIGQHLMEVCDHLDVLLRSGIREHRRRVIAAETLAITMGPSWHTWIPHLCHVQIDNTSNFCTDIA